MCSASRTPSLPRQCGISLRDLGRISLVHHWDADGIASAAHILREVDGLVIERRTPRLLEYSVDAVTPPISNADTLLVLDYGVPPAAYTRLGYTGRIVVIDHHAVKAENIPGNMVYCNPVASGAGEDEWPATAYLLYRITGRHPDLALIGVLGDRPDAPRTLRWILEELSGKAGVDLSRAVEAAKLLDACYRAGDEKCIEEAVEGLARGGISWALSSTMLKERMREVEEELQEARHRTRCMEAGEAVYCRVELINPIHTMLGRELASKMSDRVVVLEAHVKKLGQVILYVRSIERKPGTRLRGLSDRIREICSHASMGGKEKVYAIEHLEGCDTDKVVRLILEALTEGGGF